MHSRPQVYQLNYCYKLSMLNKVTLLYLFNLYAKNLEGSGISDNVQDCIQ